jgi:hypothetical protein
LKIIREVDRHFESHFGPAKLTSLGKMVQKIFAKQTAHRWAIF